MLSLAHTLSDAHLCRLLLRPRLFFSDTSPTKIYTLSLHDALPILFSVSTTSLRMRSSAFPAYFISKSNRLIKKDRKSTRLNSSHGYISYAVFCLKKKRGGSQQSPSPLYT